MVTFPLHRRGARNRQPWLIPAESLRAFVAESEFSDAHPLTKTSTAAVVLLQWIFGLDWYDRHILTNDTRAFLRYTADDPYTGQIGAQRLIDLAEMIFNFQLQGMRGLNDVLDKIDAGNIEPAYAELDTAKLLVRLNVTFGFHSGGNKRGEAYDFNLRFQNGTWGCGETECKLAKKDEPNPRSVKDSLDHARKQLPSGKPSAIFLKVPQSWMETEDRSLVLYSVVERFLFGTSRVICVLIYCGFIEPTERGPRDGFTILQMTNSRHRFDKKIHWGLVPASGPKPDEAWVSLWNT
jgi:hypothetical protein